MSLLAETRLTDLIASIVVPFLPWLIVMLPILFVFRKMIRVQRKIQADHIERMRQHMSAVEAKLDRLIEQNDRSASK